MCVCRGRGGGGGWGGGVEAFGILLEETNPSSNQNKYGIQSRAREIVGFAGSGPIFES